MSITKLYRSVIQNRKFLVLGPPVLAWVITFSILNAMFWTDTSENLSDLCMWLAAIVTIWGDWRATHYGLKNKKEKV